MNGPDSVLGTAASLAFAFSAGMAFWTSTRLFRRGQPVAYERALLPRWMRVLLPVAGRLGQWIAPAFTQHWIDVQSRRIARCDLDRGLSAEEWIGLRLVVLALCLSPLCLLTDRSASVLVGVALGAAGLGWLSTALWLKRSVEHRERLVLKELPIYLDIVTLCVESGATLTAALRVAVDKSPRSPLRDVFERVLREIRLGRPRVEALTAVARVYDIECLNALSTALAQSEGAGMSLGGVLRAQSEQRATERQLRAERSALQAPVKMLGPLVLCVFPCTFIVIAVPVVARIFLETGG